MEQVNICTARTARTICLGRLCSCQPGFDLEKALERANVPGGKQQNKCVETRWKNKHANKIQIKQTYENKIFANLHVYP